MTASEQILQLADLQKQIEGIIGSDSTQVIFDYHEKESLVAFDLITVNPRHRQSFLFHSVEGTNKLDALTKMLEYVKTYKEKENSYTIQWCLRGEEELHTSYFRSKNILEAISKLQYGREPNSIQIFSVVLNPIS